MPANVWKLKQRYLFFLILISHHYSRGYFLEFTHVKIHNAIKEIIQDRRTYWYFIFYSFGLILSTVAVVSERSSKEKWKYFYDLLFPPLFVLVQQYL